MTLAQMRRRRRAAIAQAVAAITLAVLVLTPRMEQGATEGQEVATETTLSAVVPELPNPT